MDHDRKRLSDRSRALWIPVLLAGVLLLAFGLRLYRIDAQSLWNDEGTSVALAARDLPAITRGAANDIHPPLYYYLLHFWMMLFGHSELAVRSLSALLGTLVVLLVFALGGDLWSGCQADGQFALQPDYPTALLAALFASVSPFQIYYSQETRMYILAALLGAASVYAFWRLLRSWPAAGRRLLGITGLYATTTVLLLYSHYFAVTVVLVENLAFLWWLLAGRNTPGRPPFWTLLVRWLALQVLVGLCYLPWLLVAAEQLRVWPAISAPLRLSTLVLDLLRVFSLGLSRRGDTEYLSVQARFSPVLLGFAVLLLLGLLLPLMRKRHRPAQRTCEHAGAAPLEDRTGHVLAVLYLFVPIGAMYLLSLQRPMYNPKFLLLCSVPFSLLLARGAVSVVRVSMDGLASRGEPSRAVLWLGRLLLLLAGVLVLVASWRSLHAYHFDPRYARDDYRGIAGYIQAVGTAGDAVLINAPGQIETFTYYYHGELPLYPLPLQRPLDEQQTRLDLEAAVLGHRRVFAVLWATDESDPARFIEGWLDQHTYKATDSWYGNVRLAVYAVPETSLQGRIEYPLRVDLGDAVHLLGYNLPSAEVRPGDILQLTCIWEAGAAITERYKVFTHVLDPYGHLVGQRDAEPGGGARITTIWQPGEQVVDNYGLPVLPGTPPGDYTIEIGMYALSDGRRLPVVRDGKAAGDSIILRSVRVLPALAPPSLSVLGMRKTTSARFRDVLLLGYDLARLGQEHEPDAPVHAGDILHLTLFWQAAVTPAEDLAVLVQVQDSRGKVWLERRAQPTEGMYPTAQWRANEIIRDQHNLFLPGDLPAGRSYRIALSVYGLSSGAQVGPSITLAPLAISD